MFEVVNGNPATKVVGPFPSPIDAANECRKRNEDSPPKWWIQDYGVTLRSPDCLLIRPGGPAYVNALTYNGLYVCDVISIFDACGRLASVKIGDYLIGDLMVTATSQQQGSDVEIRPDSGLPAWMQNPGRSAG